VRLFVAVEVAEPVIEALMRLVDRLRRRTADIAPRARVTWATAERLHVTLSFIGQATDDRVAAFATALGTALAVAPFDLAVAGCGAFPERGAPRVLWAGVESGRTELIALQRTVAERLAGLGVEPEKRAYQPHLTLARVRDAAGLRSPAILEGLTTTDAGTSHVRAVTLFESRLSPKGPAYVPLHRTALAGPPSTG
jgi:2'-5' RNA ligase